jgi:hypothetical protein
MKHQTTVLCVSENLYALHEIVGALEASGHRILTACSYPRAAALATAEKIDVVVMAHGNTGQTSTCPANLKFLRPEMPILLVSLAGVCSDVLPTGADMVADSLDEVHTSVEMLLTAS